MRAITVCVNYHDFLAVTLPVNARHCERVYVVTSLADKEAAYGAANVTGPVRNVPLSLILTDVFYENGATFNKGRAVEEASRLAAIRAEGWLAVIDADTMLPDDFTTDGLVPGNLYVPRRRMCRYLDEYHAGDDWEQWPVIEEMDFGGYCQIFHTSDPVLQERPWFPTNWKHAGGYDTEFQAKWAPEHRVRPDFNVLHLGEERKNWYGRCTPMADGTVLPGSEDRREAMRNMDRMRRVVPGFGDEKLPGG